MTARKTKTARIRVLVSFNGMIKGDEATLELTPRVQGWINAGVVKVVGDGKDPARPGTAESSAAGSLPLGAGDSGPSGDEQGKGFGSSGYGASPGVDSD